MLKNTVQAQFGANASAYVASKVHAKGASLARLVELVDPQSTWRVLDIATAAGHTAHTFAPYVKEVVAADITFEMLDVAMKSSHRLGITNVIPLLADAENLPIADQQFDLATCRIAAHHFPDVEKFMAGSFRILKNDGLLAVVDNVVPGNIKGRKSGRAKEECGRYVNALDKLRDPSHARSLSIDEWQRYFYEAGFRVIHQEYAKKALRFNAWVERMNVPATNVVRLKAMLHQAPKPVIEFLNPRIRGNDITFDLLEAIFVAIKE